MYSVFKGLRGVAEGVAAGGGSGMRRQENSVIVHINLYYSTLHRLYLSFLYMCFLFHLFIGYYVVF
jgi:hypothetical protein